MSVNKKGSFYIAPFNQEYKTSGEKVYDSPLEHITHNNIKILMQMATHDNMSTHFYLSQEGWHTFFSLLKQYGILCRFSCFFSFFAKARQLFLAALKIYCVRDGIP